MDDVEPSRMVLETVVNNIENAIVGKRRTVELVVLAMASGGHVLIEDIPGVGKTSLVWALAQSVDCSFSRIQFTPDILPSDVTGFSIYNPKTGEFDFRPGAVMSNFVLADEINRTSPKTQASLLEIMEENQVTVDLHTYTPPQPFMVLATQNPNEYLGTYPLPESEIDRFLIKVSLGYPDPDDEMRILSAGNHGAAAKLSPVADASDILAAREASGGVFVEKCVRKYIVDIVNATRKHPDITLGASPRGSISLYRMAQSRALYCGRNFVIPDDVKFLAPYVLCHRLILGREAKIAGKSPEDIIEGILNTVCAPAVKSRPVKERLC
jgi:MoxR-like ATPase